jgi:ferredoxin-NADP reductase/Na+-translocating ferredoxin:NAD+ oxidoreductase RnfD subunit
MMEFIDEWLNRITMYRLVLYYLIALLVTAGVLAMVGLMPLDPLELLFSTVFAIVVCWVTNIIFAKTYRAPTNVESAYITALILALIISPPKTMHDVGFIAWASVLAMASKYILAINAKHLFNPAAAAVVVTGLFLGQTASWWVGSAPMLPVVLIGGLLIVRKLRRFSLAISFVLVALVTSVVIGFLGQVNLLTMLQEMVLSSPMIFFAAVILTEPLTTPPTRNLQVLYGGLVGLLFSPQIHFGTVYLSPELAIVLGNVYSYIISPKAKLVLRLKEKIQIGPDTYDFIFVPRRKLAFEPGQYMEWTLDHEHPDSRGNRRYFTLASSPTENALRLGVKFYKNSSSYKKKMLAMDTETEIVASQLAGDFVLPDDRSQKIVLIAGGIGITPFRSMIKYLLDRRERRPIVLFYANKTNSEIVYKDVLDEAQRELGIKVVYTVTEPKKVGPNWKGKIGRIDTNMIKREVPDYRNCVFYVSGPNAMVNSYREVLEKLGVKNDQIRTDFFPGFA